MGKDELKHRKAIRGIYWMPAVLLPLFYLQAADCIFNLFSGDIKGLLQTFCYMIPLLKLPPLNKKRRALFIEEEITKEGISTKILSWVYILCVSMICIWLIGFFFEPQGLFLKIFVGISCVVNSIFAILLIIGKFNKQ